MAGAAVPEGLVPCSTVPESGAADCYMLSESTRDGYVVYYGFRGCLNSWLAVPGFMLLPTGLLAGAKAERHSLSAFVNHAKLHQAHLLL